MARIDRTQQREPRSTTAHPRIAELVDIERRAGRDLAWIVVAAVLVCAVSLWVGAVDKAIDSSARLERWNLNGLVPLLLLSPLGASFYAWRRYHEGVSAQRELAHLTVHDSLTGLPNRRFLGESFRRMLEEHRRDVGHIAVLFVDLDRFKNVNDTYGHEAGDRLMQAVADRLRTAVKTEDVVVRYAGDEFVLVIGAVPSAAVAQHIASRLIKVLETPFEMGQDRIQISASIGIALAEDNVQTPGDVIRDADAAMYQAKAHGSGTFAVFDRSMRNRLTPSTAEHRLRDAIEGDEFQILYQPVVSLWTRRLVGVEAVLRWNDPDHGDVSPRDFLPALEDTGLIVPVGRWLLRKACEQSCEWAVQFPDRPPLQVTVRVSPRELSQSDLVDHLRTVIHETGVIADSIVLTIDDRSLQGDLGLMHHTLRSVRKLGVRLALDDSGGGIGALGHLRGLEIDVLRIDPTYLTSITDSQRDRAVIEHVIGLAKAIGISTLAAGVDHAPEVERLAALGCDLALGPYFAVAQPPGVITALLESPVAQSFATEPPQVDPQISPLPHLRPTKTTPTAL